jgi:hypothetical protein
MYEASLCMRQDARNSAVGRRRFGRDLVVLEALKRTRV